MNRRLALAGAAALLPTLLVSACAATSTAPSTAGGSAASTPLPTVTPESPPSTAGASTAVAGAGIPDPCALLTTEQISAVTGSDPGPGEEKAFDPAIRRICSYESGLILAVEVADDYAASVELIRADENVQEATDVSGLGEEALFTSYGSGVGQVVALQGLYFVGVTGVLDEKQAAQLAQAMLDAL